ncbi:MAG TPA: glycosyltransferase family 61 protein [Rhizomicrobium sp.]
MAVRRLSSRYLRWTAVRLATRAFAALKKKLPFYDHVISLRDGGETEIAGERQSISLSPEEARFAARFDKPVPPVVERSIALVKLSGATVLGNTGAVIDEARGVLFQSHYAAARYAPGVASYHDFLDRPSRLIDKPPANYFTMVGEDRGHRHYFHFLFDRLPRLHYLLQHFAVGREPLVVLTNADLPMFQRDIYRFLAEQHPNLSFVAVPEDERWLLPTLYLIDEDQPVRRTLLGADTVQLIRNLVFEGYGIAPKPASRRLYINRSDARKRRIVNEAEIWPLFEARGFESVAAATLSFEAQIALFAEAAVVAGPHGAGFANMLFAPEGARLIEIVNLEKVKDTYLLLAKSLGQRHSAVIGSQGDRNEWFRADPQAIEVALADL